jgi:hypothetical protein
LLQNSGRDFRTIMPQGFDDRERMSFYCDCGFVYQLSYQVPAERGLQAFRLRARSVRALRPGESRFD